MTKTQGWALLLGLCFFCTANAQSLVTKVRRVEIDGKETNTTYNVFFLSNGKWIKSRRTPSGFAVPKRISARDEITILFTFGNYRLTFPDIDSANLREEWVVGVDNRPFSEEFVRPEEAGEIKSAYYVQFESTEPVRQIIVTKK